jgi:Pretoxin HINT domain
VTLADGKTIPIGRLKIGDHVLAFNTKTGRTQVETVDAVMAHHDTDLIDVTVKSPSGSSTIHSTQHHLFWDVTTRSWTEAQKLAIGDHLETPTGSLATVARVAVVAGSGYMWDLTVSNDHDFYVGVGVGGQSAVLVHNCPGTREGDLPARGEPNSSGFKDDGAGNMQIREYGPDGNAETDYDFGHDHSDVGDPHAHDWDWDQTPARGPARPLLSGE